MAVNVMITDDHSMIREGLKQLLELEGDFKVVAEAAAEATDIEEEQRRKREREKEQAAWYARNRK